MDVNDMLREVMDKQMAQSRIVNVMAASYMNDMSLRDGIYLLEKRINRLERRLAKLEGREEPLVEITYFGLPWGDG